MAEAWDDKINKEIAKKNLQKPTPEQVKLFEEKTGLKVIDVEKPYCKRTMASCGDRLRIKRSSFVPVGMVSKSSMSANALCPKLLETIGM